MTRSSPVDGVPGHTSYAQKNRDGRLALLISVLV